jgi:tetratricopeptide (TPR) repeat protein
VVDPLIRKSHIALEYVHGVLEKSPYVGAFWVDASSVDKFHQAYKHIAVQLGLRPWMHPGVDEIHPVSAWLNNAKNMCWLMVLDNADDADVAEHIISCLPIGSNVSILITSRDKRLALKLTGLPSRLIDVQPMTVEDARTLLSMRVSNANSSDADSTHLVECLDLLPLAITQVADYIQMHHVTITWCLDLSVHSWAKLLSRKSSDLGDDLGCQLPVLVTFWRSLDYIATKNPLAANIVSRMAVLANKGIPEMLLHRDGVEDGKFRDALNLLKAFSLINENGEASVDIPRLVQLSAQLWLGPKMARWNNEAVVLLSKIFPQGSDENWKMCEVLMPHAEVVIEYDGRPDLGHDLVLPERVTLLHNMACYAEKQGRYADACQRGMQTLAIREMMFGKEHPDTLMSMNNLANVLRRKGKYEEAEKIHRQTLELRQRVVGEEHPDTLMSINNLGAVLDNQGKYEEAEQMYRQALKLREKVLGKDHLDTLGSRHNLANVLRRKEKHEEVRVVRGPAD